MTLVLLAGVVPLHAGKTAVEATYTIVGQESDSETAARSLTGSLDAYLTWRGDGGSGRLDVYLEGNTSLKSDGVATLYPRSNADAGTALDPERSGRFQLSELKYNYTWSGRQRIAVGLLDPSAYLDSTRINNDENLQFLGASFVNNPTIEFPDYTLGLAARLPTGEDRWAVELVLAGSNGIADNPNLSYSQLLNVTDDAKGLFAGAEASWRSEKRLVRVGAWLNGAAHESLDGLREDLDNHGAYALVGLSWNRWAANSRVGIADADVSLARSFASISLQRESRKRVVGLAAARTWISPDARLTGAEHGFHGEAYLRLELARDLYLTPSVQYLGNARFDSPNDPGDEDVVVFGLRLHHSFFKRGGDPAR